MALKDLLGGMVPNLDGIIPNVGGDRETFSKAIHAEHVSGLPIPSGKGVKLKHNPEKIVLMSGRDEWTLFWDKVDRVRLLSQGDLRREVSEQSRGAQAHAPLATVNSGIFDHSNKLFTSKGGAFLVIEYESATGEPRALVLLPLEGSEMGVTGLINERTFAVGSDGVL